MLSNNSDVSQKNVDAKGDVIAGSKTEITSIGQDSINGDKITYQIDKLIMAGSGVTHSDVIKILEENIEPVILKKYPEFSGKSYPLVRERTLKLLEKIFQNFNSDEELMKSFKEGFLDPDFVYIFTKSILISARKDEDTLRESLSILLADRIKSNDNNFRKIVYNRDIQNLDILTTDHLKAITVCWLINNVVLSHVNSWEQFLKHLDEDFAPFLDFNCSQAETLHILYSVYGSNDWAGKNFFDSITAKYNFLRYKDLNESIVDSLAISDEFKKELFTKDQKEKIYSINYPKIESVKSKLDKNSLQTLETFLSRNENHVGDCKEFKNKIVKGSSIGEKLYEKYKSSSLYGLDLSPTGFLIASVFFEITTKRKLGINIWKDLFTYKIE